MSVFSFRKDEILRKNKLIEQLFAEGNSFFIHPFKVFYLVTPLETTYPVQILITVGKRVFRFAVKRNRVKRQIREVYRLNKHTLYEHLAGQKKQCVLAIIYTSNNHIPTEDLDIKIKAVVNRLLKEFDKNLNKPSHSLSVI